MMLSDVDIEKEIRNGRLQIDPYNSQNLGPCSIDLTLDSVFRIYHPGTPIDIRGTEPIDRDSRIVDTGERPFMILPGQFVLGQTRERVTVSVDFAALLEGRSSVARLGIIVHTAGLVNPGTGIEKPGRLTLEIFCENLSPVLLYPGMRIVQIMFIPLSHPAKSAYDKRDGSRYVGQESPTIR